jgi:hypothetical protein
MSTSDVLQPKHYYSMMSEKLSIFFGKPFESSFEMSSVPSNLESKMAELQISQQTNNCTLKKEFIFVIITLKTESAFPIELVGEDYVVGKTDCAITVWSRKTDMINSIWTSGSMFKFFFVISIDYNIGLDMTTRLGSFNLLWRREGDSQICRSSFDLPEYLIEKHGVGFRVELPSHALFNVPFNVHYEITNNSPLEMEELYGVCDGNDNFVFSGFKQTTFKILPLQTYVLTYRYWPLRSGQLQLPHLHMSKKINDSKQECDATISPLFIFVKPK